MKQVIFNGKKYKLYEGTKYYSSGPIRLHRKVWEYHNGEIPKGYEVHHIDFDSTNNDISNLMCIPAKEHKRIHMELMTEKRKEQLREHLKKNARPKASEWHKSEAGNEWHKKHYEKMKDKLYAKELKPCLSCGNEFLGYLGNGNKFCSNKCKSKYRRDNKLDHIDKKCIICNGIFRRSKYSKTLTCGNDCKSKLREQRKKGGIL